MPTEYNTAKRMKRQANGGREGVQKYTVSSSRRRNMKLRRTTEVGGEKETKVLV